MPDMTEPQNDPALQALADIDPLIHAPARLMVLTYLYVVDSVDYVFLMRMTGLTWGNLSTHLAKLEEAGYVAIDKEFKGKKPHSMVRLTDRGRSAFRDYKESMQQVLNNLPDGQE
jgi:DNA-binding MarR family transcriptional regulator